MRDRGVTRPMVKSLVARHARNVTVRDVRLLAASTQAKVFIVDLEGRPEPLVAKLFKSRWPDVTAAVEDEYESLSLMSGAFRELDADGWRVTAPEPLFRSSVPPALIMTSVSGVPVEVNLPSLTSAERSDLARRICEALVAYWSATGRMIADVTLSNILIDAPRRQLAFVDPGLPIAEFSCPGVPSDFAPGSRDLAYLLTHVLTTNARIRLLNRGRAKVRAACAEDVIRHYATEHLVSRQSRAFLAEVSGCAAQYVDLVPAGGPLEPWRRFVREQAKRELAITFGKLAER